MELLITRAHLAKNKRKAVEKTICKQNLRGSGKICQAGASPPRRVELTLLDTPRLLISTNQHERMGTNKAYARKTQACKIERARRLWRATWATASSMRTMTLPALSISFAGGKNNHPSLPRAMLARLLWQLVCTAGTSCRAAGCYDANPVTDLDHAIDTLT